MPGTRAVDETLTRLGATSPTARDAVLALAWALVSLALLLLGLSTDTGADEVALGGTRRAVLIALVVVQCLLLVGRRRSPVACVLAVAAVQAAILAVVPLDVTVRGAAPLVAAYTLATLRETPVVVRALAAGLALEVVGFVLAVVGPVSGVPAGTPTGRALAWVGLALLAAVLASVAAGATGSWVALRREQQRGAAEAVVRAREHQQALAREAVGAERTRMARELHDIAAHHLSGLVVQAGAAERLVDTDPAAAKEMIRSLRGQGRETLANMRSIVGVLRATDADGAGGPGTPGVEGEGGTPVPGLARLPELVEQARAAGDAVTWSSAGAGEPLAPIADVTAYRIAQEALANARRHAPGAPVALTLTRDASGLRLAVVNELRPASAQERGGPGADEGRGHGVVGMRERAALVGAQLEVGPAAGGTWRVELHLPADRAAS